MGCLKLTYEKSSPLKVVHSSENEENRQKSVLWNNPIRFTDPDGMAPEDKVDRPLGAEEDHTHHTITLETSGSGDNLTQKVTENTYSSTGEYTYDDDGNATGWKVSTSNTTTVSTINSAGKVTSTTEGQTTSTTEYSLQKITKVNLVGSKQINGLGDVTSSNSNTVSYGKARGSDLFTNLVNVAADFTNATGESINYANQNAWLSQPHPSDGTAHAAGIAAMFETKKQKYYEVIDGNRHRDRINSTIQRSLLRTSKKLIRDKR